MKKVIIIVNYNKKYITSNTYQSLKKIKEINKYKVRKIIFWDNRATSENYQIEKEIDNMEYIACPENRGLAYIYNYIIKNYCQKNEFLILLDNDSEITSEYFEKLENSINAYNKINLHVPVVLNNKKIYSPNRNILLFNFYFKKIKFGKINSKRIFAINSGMCISTNYLLKKYIGYDEELQFYGTDNYFMQVYQKNNEELCVFDYEMNHELSAFDINEDIEKKLWRFRDIKHSLRVMMKYKTGIEKMIIYLYIWSISIKKSIQYKDKRFIGE